MRRYMVARWRYSHAVFAWGWWNEMDAIRDNAAMKAGIIDRVGAMGGGEPVQEDLPAVAVRGGPLQDEALAGAGFNGSAKHLFSRSVAKTLERDAEAAVLYRHLRYWCDLYRRQKSEHHYRSGCYWRYDSLDALHVQFPYLTGSAIYHKLRKLRAAGYIVIHCLNDWSGDKTRWYHARRKDKQGNATEADGKVAFVIEEARRLNSITQACTLTFIRPKIERNRAGGRAPEALLGPGEFMFLLPFSSRTIRLRPKWNQPWSKQNGSWTQWNELLDEPEQQYR